MAAPQRSAPLGRQPTGPSSSAWARLSDEGRRLALTGVAPTPVLVQPDDVLDPAGDFRGSSDYRRALADVLLARAVEAIA